MLVTKVGFIRSLLAASMGALFPMIIGCATISLPEVTPEQFDEVSEEAIHLALEMEREYLSRLHELAWPIFKANTEFCGSQVAPALGVVLGKPNSFFKSKRPIYTPRSVREHKSVKLQLSPFLSKENDPKDYLVVLAVIANSPADEAGIQVGDKIMEAKGPKSTLALNPSMGMIEKGLDNREDMSLLVVIKRGDELLEVEAIPETICRATLNVELLDEAVSAWFSRSLISFTSARMKLADHDSCVQAVIAHELAHITEGHLRDFFLLYSMTWPIDALGMALRVITFGKMKERLSHRVNQSLEREADYVGLYMLARAGIEMTCAKDKWLRFAIERPPGDIASTHPSNLERHFNLMAAWKEIQEKIEKGMPLVPERKGNRPNIRDTSYTRGTGLRAYRALRLDRRNGEIR